MNQQQRLRELQMQLIVLNLVDFVPTTLFALAVHTLVSPPEQALFGWLQQPWVPQSLLVVSVPLMAWCGWRMLRIARERKALLGSQL